MDGNKDDALKSLKIGKQALQSGNLDRAKKFIAKAQRLDPSLSIDEDLLSQISSQQQSDAGNSTADSPVPPQSKPSDQQQPSSVRNRKGSGSAGSSGNYTEEQVLIVREIKRKKDYYDILGVEKSCSVEDVRKAYRKLSLKVHPDKNKAPGAEEAFKAVSKAFQCLSNEENRRKYDVSGSDEPVYERAPMRRHRGHGFSNGYYYEADFDADEIFRQFFFGGMGQTTQFRGFNFGNAGMGGQHRQRHDAGDNNGANGFNFRMLIQLLPVLLILLLNFLPSSDPVYVLSRQYPYDYKFSTSKGVNYYVKSTKFEQDYPPNSEVRAGLEQRVEREYFSILGQNCQLETQRRQWGFIRETPHCDMLRKFREEAAAAAA